MTGTTIARTALRMLMITAAAVIPLARGAREVHAQETPIANPRPFWMHLPLTFNGEANTTGELYRHGGDTDARRPAAMYRMSFSPQATLFKQVTLGADLLLSSDGNELRQNVNQAGLNPSYKWITLHLGDFSRDYSQYTLSGTRIRGGGIDLTPGSFEFSFQAGRAQRTVAADAGDGGVFKRSMFGLAAGFHSRGGNSIGLSLLKAKDDPNSLEQSLVVVDTTFADTALVPDRLKFATTPEENLVVGINGEFSLFRNALRIKGETGAALFTRDLRSRTVSDDELGGLAVITGLQPIRVSTSGDYAYTGEADLNLGTIGLRGGYEQIGAGYTSLGLPYLISDRRGYNFGGNVSLLNNRVMLQGERREQSNNLVDQRAARTDRGSNTATVVLALSQRINTSFTALTTNASTAASDLTPAIDAHALALTSTVSSQIALLGKKTAVSLAYGYQKSNDEVPNSVIPTVIGNNLTASILMTMSPAVSIGPNISAVTSKASNATEKQNNVLLGFNARAKLLKGQKLVTSANLSNTFSSGRRVMSARADASYPLMYGTRLQLQARQVNYAAFATRKAFNESFVTATLSRSFSAGR